MSYIHTTTVKNDSLEVARGLMPNVRSLFVLGFNNNIDAGDQRMIWDGDFKYTFSEIADISTIVSDSVDDSGKLFKIRGLDADWNEIYHFVSLQGVTPIEFPPMIRINEVRQVSGKKNKGKITIYTQDGNPSTQTDIRAIIRQGYGKTQMGLFSVPANHNAYFNDFVCRVRRRGSTGDISSNCFAELRLFGSDFVKEIVLPIHTEGGQQSVSSDNYFKVPEKSDIIITAQNDSSNNGIFGASLNGKLIKNTE